MGRRAEVQLNSSAAAVSNNFQRRLKMIVRIIAVDPRPRKGESDLVVYQVPEHSRSHELLVEVFKEAGIEVVTIETPPKGAK
jgi:hypothetical protein